MPPAERLAKLSALEQWLDWQLHDTRRKIRQLTAQVEQERRRRERAHAEQRWKLEPRRGTREAILHRGGCGQWTRQMGYLTRQEVLLALTDDELKIEPCGICRPETGLQT
ncbi:DUF6233 domain-containing protein [Streptomyces phaeochromogenes]|uniref:DUF6233 domain-containing protein n=1 Tax=Streptomyces phaeochromogenes TaxID=1923 RepID=UPI00225B1E3E|nr:DUF6233 domain-containing protein [Streptomyces phaeochromogenes]MCX5601641.1 DUF6233 domain-containing protein [Streptomyces phaeochromogenes]